MDPLVEAAAALEEALADLRRVAADPPADSEATTAAITAISARIAALDAPYAAAVARWKATTERKHARYPSLVDAGLDAIAVMKAVDDLQQSIAAGRGARDEWRARLAVLEQLVANKPELAELVAGVREKIEG